ncbi:hypothetical protein M3Y96_01028700 [Aphelenchoides besseyi]|nr:hypothetical protein M3Y96_01028700 [Aphelenchoides besseyi]
MSGRKDVSSSKRNSFVWQVGLSRSLEDEPQQALVFYWPSVFVLFTFGLVNVLCIYINGLVGSILALTSTVFFFEWLKLHGDKLTRRERAFFDEKNILDTSTAFDFNLMSPVFDDTTPGNCCGAYPKSLPQMPSIFHDQEEEKLQKFYQEHYGGMHSKAKRVEKERQVDDQKDKTK